MKTFIVEMEELVKIKKTKCTPNTSCTPNSRR